jgi:dolichyl-phosphate-mannose--protein O-mannosyl transferase
MLYAAMTASLAFTAGYGASYDENWQLSQVAHTYATGSLLPGHYNYPSGAYWLTLFATLPHAALSRAQGISDATSVEALLHGRPNLHARLLFLLINELTLLWVFLIARSLGMSPGMALLAPLLLGFSYEFTYHARWLSTDGPAAQFVALTIWLSLRYLKDPHRSPWLPSVAAGLAFGMKYNAVVAFIPVATAIVLKNDREKKRALWACLQSAAIFSAVFLVTTPGAVFDQSKLVHDVRMQLNFYRHADFRFTVESGSARAAKIGYYLMFQSLSHYPVISALIACFSIAGAVAVYRRDRPAFLVLLPFAVIYLAYASTFRVMIVRNYLLVIPVIAVMAAAGVGEVRRLSRANRIAWGCASAAMVCALAANAWWHAVVVRSLVLHDSIDVRSEIVRYLRESATPLYISPVTRATLGDAAAELERSRHVAPAIDGAEWAMLWTSEAPVERFEANAPGKYRLLPSGPFEVNFAYYGLPAGPAHPVIVRADDYKRLFR